MLLSLHLKPFVCLNQLQLVCNFFWNKQNPINNQLCNHHHHLTFLSSLYCLIRSFTSWLLIGWSWKFLPLISISILILSFYTWKKVSSVRIDCNSIIITLISKNKQSVDFLTTRINWFSYGSIRVIWFFRDYFACLLIVLIILHCLLLMKWQLEHKVLHQLL